MTSEVTPQGDIGSNPSTATKVPHPSTALRLLSPRSSAVAAGPVLMVPGGWKIVAASRWWWLVGWCSWRS